MLFSSQIALKTWFYFTILVTNGLTAQGYAGAAFDGRFIYFSPFYNGGYHGIALRHDTQADFTSSWEAYDAGNTNSFQTSKGYSGVIYAAPYVYFVPYRCNPNDIFHGNVLRYDPLLAGKFLLTHWEQVILGDFMMEDTYTLPQHHVVRYNILMELCLDMIHNLSLRILLAGVAMMQLLQTDYQHAAFQELFTMEGIYICSKRQWRG